VGKHSEPNLVLPGLKNIIQTTNANFMMLKNSDASNIQVVFAASKDTMIFNAMKDSGIPVERKNSAASTASSSGKGSSDSAFGDEKE
jgi:hypothetical protein